jgi:hypothetical protein
MTTRARLTAAAIAALLAVDVACVVATKTDQGTATLCNDDRDCGAQRFCTDAQICRTDCFVDSDCLGLGVDAQCNAHGRCVAPVVDAPVADVPPEAPDDVSGDASTDVDEVGE